MSAGAGLTAAQRAAPTEEAAAGGKALSETYYSRGNTVWQDVPSDPLWQGCPHAVDVEKYIPEGQPNRRKCASMAPSVTDAAHAGAFTLNNAAYNQPVAAPAAISSRTYSQSNTNKNGGVTANTAENAPAGFSLCEGTGRESILLSWFPRQPAQPKSPPDAVYCRNTMRSDVNFPPADTQQYTDSHVQATITTPLACEGLQVQRCSGIEGNVSAARADAIATSSFGEEGFVHTANSSEGVALLGGHVQYDEATLVRHEVSRSVPPAGPSVSSATMNEELHFCKQQMLEMKARLDAVWSQKEAFRQANERLSRAVGRLQRQDIASRHRKHPPLLDLRSPVVALSTERLSPPSGTEQTPRPLSRRLIAPPRAAAGDVPFNFAPSNRSARRHPASPVAVFSECHFGPRACRSSQRQESESPDEGHRTWKEDHGRRKKGNKKECETSEFNLGELASLAPSLLCPQGARTRQKNSSCFEDRIHNDACGYSRAFPGARATHGTPLATRRQEDEATRQLLSGGMPHRGLSTTHMLSESRRSLPPVPRLDLRGLLQAQHQAAGVPASKANRAACAILRDTRRGRRRSPSRRSSSKSLAAVETDRLSGSSGPPDFSGEADFVTMQVYSGVDHGDKSKSSRRSKVSRRVCEGADLSRQSGPLIRTERTKKQTRAQARTSPANSDHSALCRQKDCACRRLSDAQRDALLDARHPLHCSCCGQEGRQRSVGHRGQKFDSAAPLPNRPGCVAGCAWRPMNSMRSTVAGLGQKDRASISAHPSLAETAMKTPRTCFLDDRIVRVPHSVRSFASEKRDSSPVHRPAATTRTTTGNTARDGECAATNDADSASADDGDTALLSLEEQLANHVRHCMELLKCTDASREDDVKSANVLRQVRGATARSAATRTAPSCAEKDPRDEPAMRGKIHRGATTAGDSPASIARSTPGSPGDHTVLDAGEDTTLKACVRKPRDGYWHVIYTCVIKVRGTEYFLDVRFSGDMDAPKNGETARLIATKERAGVFKVCIRHLLRSTRDFFDSAKVLWWQPLPVVCSDEWLPYDELMRRRADAHIRELRAKYPELAAAARARECKRAAMAQASRAAMAQASSVNGRAKAGVVERLRTREKNGEDGSDAELRERREGSSKSSPSPTCTAQHARKDGNNVCVRERDEGAKITCTCNSSFPQHQKGSQTEVTRVERAASVFAKAAEPEAAALDERQTPRNTCREYVSSAGGDCTSDCRSAGESTLHLEKPRNSSPTNVAPNVRRAASRYDSEWDAVGLVYVGSLSAEQQVAQFKRILSSCSSSAAESGGWYVSNAKPKPRCMLTTPSSDISFLLSEPLGHCDDDNSDSSSCSVPRARSFDPFKRTSKDSEAQYEADIQSISERSGSLYSKVTNENHTTELPKESSRQEGDDPDSAVPDPAGMHISYDALKSAVECGGAHEGEVCKYNSSNSSSSVTSSSGSPISRSSHGSSHSSVTASTGSGRMLRRSLYRATSAAKKQNAAPRLPESSEAAFDKTCQPSLSRRLGPQELFIVRRRDREEGCFPLYHHFSGRYLCVNATSGLVGMLGANATPAAATAARALQQEIKASGRLASAKAHVNTGILSQSPGFAGCAIKPSRRHRRSEDYWSKSSAEESFKEEDQQSRRVILMKDAGNEPPASAKVEANAQTMPVENGAKQPQDSTAVAPPATDALCHIQEQLCSVASPLTATAVDSCASAATSNTSDNGHNSLADGNVMPKEGHKTSSSDHGEDAYTRCQEVPPREASGVPDKYSTGAAHAPGSAVDIAVMPGRENGGTCGQRGEAEPGDSLLLGVGCLHRNTRRVTVSSEQQEVRNLGASTYANSPALASERPADRPDTSCTHREFFTAADSVHDASTDVSGEDCTARENNTGIVARQETVIKKNTQRYSLLTPSFFELVTVSDLLVQQTVARILASVPHATVADNKPGAIRYVFKRDAHMEEAEESADRATEQADTSTRALGADILKIEESQPLVSVAHSVAKESDAKATCTILKSRDEGGDRLYPKRHCIADGFGNGGTDAFGTRRRGSEVAAVSCRLQKVPSARRRSSKDPRPAPLETPPTATSVALPRCLLTASTSKRNSVPWGEKNTVSRDFHRELFKSKRGATQRPLSAQKSSMKAGRRVPTHEIQTQQLAQDHFGQHRRCRRRTPDALNRTENAFSSCAAQTSQEFLPFGVAPRCEQFSLDDCDALTEIANEETRAGRRER